MRKRTGQRIKRVIRNHHFAYRDDKGYYRHKQDWKRSKEGYQRQKFLRRYRKIKGGEFYGSDLRNFSRRKMGRTPPIYFIHETVQRVAEKWIQKTLTRKKLWVKPFVLRLYSFKEKEVYKIHFQFTKKQSAYTILNSVNKLIHEKAINKYFEGVIKCTIKEW